MKKTLSIIITAILSITLSAQDMEVYFMHASFNSPNGPYIETYLSFIGKSLAYKSINKDETIAEVEVTVIFKQGDEIKQFDKYTIKHPGSLDTLKTTNNFVDQQRYRLENGIYNLEIIVKDLNSDGSINKFVDIITIDYNDRDLKFSEIQFIENAEESKEESVKTKNNLDLTPYVSNFFPQNIDRLMFYVELYNSDNKINDDFMLRYYIEKFESKREFSELSRFRRMTAAPINPLLGELNIESLPSGNYNLVLEVRNRNNELIQSKRIFFQRSKFTQRTNDELVTFTDFEFDNMFYGDVTNEDSLKEYISSLRPLANTIEQSFIDYRVISAPKQALQQFFIDFWRARDPINPNRSWMIYKEQVDFVNRSYTTFISKGYQTDRGRVYLQYGTPNSIYVSKHEPSAYPYEIWQYHEVANERNKRFVFYNPALVGEEFELLHSELTGEIKNPNWERLLHRRNHTIYDFDQMNSDDHWGSRARDEFRK